MSFGLRFMSAARNLHNCTLDNLLSQCLKRRMCPVTSDVVEKYSKYVILNSVKKIEPNLRKGYCAWNNPNSQAW